MMQTKNRQKRIIRINPLTGEKTVLDGIGDYIHLQNMVRYHLGTMGTGALLLQRSKTKLPSVVFGFSFPGIHNEIASENLSAVANSIENGLKSIPEGRLMVHFSSTTDCDDRIEELKRSISLTEIDVFKQALADDIIRASELSNKGLREPKSIYLYVTFTPELADDGPPLDGFESTLRDIGDLYSALTGTLKTEKKRALHQTLYNAYFHGYQRWFDTLYTEMELRVRPLTALELYINLYQRFNRDEPDITLDEFPQLLEVYETHTEEIVRSDKHIINTFFPYEVPIFRENYIKVRGEYQAVLYMKEKPGTFHGLKNQLNYHYNRVAKDSVTMDIFTEIRSTGKLTTSLDVHSLGRQSRKRIQRAKDQYDSSTRAELILDDTTQLEIDLNNGVRTISTGTVFLVREREDKHKNPKQALQRLSERCKTIAKLYPQPARVVREVVDAYTIWMQTLPCYDQELLYSQQEPIRLSYTSKEVWGLMPLSNTLNSGRGGIELLSDDGGTPIRVNPVDPQNQKHMIIYGKTRYGKSVFVAEIIKMCLVQGIPCVLADYPKEDGRGTFDVFTKLLGRFGAYINIQTECVNLFERPELSGLPEELRETRLNDFTSFLKSIINIMVLGEDGAVYGTQPVLAKTTESILSTSIDDFFVNPDIGRRFNEAEGSSIGSDAWRNTPTLKDFYAFCSPTLIRARLATNGELSATKIVEEAITLIQLGLRKWLTSKVGRSISKPSTISSSALLKVFAFQAVDDQSEAAILSLVATASAFRLALKHPRSVFVIDETPILFNFAQVALNIHKLVSNGSKSGIQVIILAQHPNIIARSKPGKDIIANMSLSFIGRISPEAVSSYTNLLETDHNRILECTAFKRNSLQLYTKWLLVSDTGTTKVRYYPSPFQLAMVANGQDEQAVRQLFLSKHPNDPLTAMVQFSAFLKKSIQSGQELIPMAEEAFNTTILLDNKSHTSETTTDEDNLSLVPNERYAQTTPIYKTIAV